MNKNLSFILDKTKVYTDMCLVRDEIPIFFTCIDEDGRFYLALCTDMDIPQYCVVRVAVAQLNSMLQGMLSMKEMFILQKKCWIVTPIDDNVKNDKVVKKNTVDLREEDLPDEDAYFELFNDELKEYAETIRDKMLEGEFEPSFVDKHEIINGIQADVIYRISNEMGEISFSVENCDMTEIKKEMVIQNTVLLEYKKEEGYIIAKTDSFIVGQKNICNKNIMENVNENSSVVAA